GRVVLLSPESVLILNPTATVVLGLCDGQRSFATLTAELAARFYIPISVVTSDVAELLGRLHERGLVMLNHRASCEPNFAAPIDEPRAPRAFGLLAELTYRCPLHCPYCSNPVRVSARNELTTEEWCDVLVEASDLGALHVHFSG